MRIFDCSFQDAMKRLNSDFNLGLYNQTYREKKAARTAFMEKQRRLKEEEAKKEAAEREYWIAFDRWNEADRIQREGEPFSEEWLEAVKSLPQLSYELTLAEERRREIGNAP